MAISELQKIKNEIARFRGGGVEQAPSATVQTNLREDTANKDKPVERAVKGVGYLGEQLGLGILRSVEGISDYLIGGAADILGADELAENIMKNDWVNYNHANEWYDPGKAMAFVGDVAQGVGGMLPSLAITWATAGAAAPVALAGQVGSTAAFTLGAAGQSTSEAVKKTGDLSGKEWLYGTASGALETGIEALTGGIGGTKAGKVVGKQLGKTALGKAAISFAGEGVEEVVSDVANPLLKRATGVDKTAKMPTAQELGRTFAVGGATGAVMGALNTGISSLKAGGYNNYKVGETSQELANENAESNQAQAEGEKSIYGQEDRKSIADRLSKRLQKMSETDRKEFLSRNSNIAFMFNENGTVAETSSGENTTKQEYNADSYSESLKGYENKLAYKPLSFGSVLATTAKNVMNTLTKITQGKANIVLTEEKLSADDGQSANGLYKDGIIYLNAEATDGEKALAVGVHEVVHSLEGTKEYNELAKYISQQIKNDPDLAQRYNIDAYRNAYDKLLKGEWTEDTKDYQAATEIFADYIGNVVSENKTLLNNLVARNSNVFVRFLNWVRNSIAKLGESAEERKMRKDLQTLEKMLVEALQAGNGGITLEEVEDLARTAEKRLKTQDGNVQSVKFGENKNADGKLATARFSTDLTFAEQVDAVLAGTDVQSSHLQVRANTPKILLDVGLSDKPMLITSVHTKTAVGKEVKNKNIHNIDVDVFKELPKLLEKPAIIMDSTKKNSIVVFVNAVDQAKNPIMCAINIQGEGYYNSVKIDTNLIASAYGKDNNPIGFIKRAVNENRVLHWDKKMSQALFEIPGLQLPDNLNRLDSNVIIRKTNANVNSFLQNSSKKVEKTSTSRSSLDVTEQSIKEAETDRAERKTSSARFSLKYANEIAERQFKDNEKFGFHVTDEKLSEAIESTARMVDRMSKHLDILPEDKIGKKNETIKSNSSYDKSIENTTICVRTLSYNQFVDKVQERLGRPLTQAESFLASQKLYEIAVDPQCLYCYVSLDRKAYNEFLLRYINERDEVIGKYNHSNKSKKAVEKLYEEYRNNRKDTENMRKRFNMFIEMAEKGIKPLSAKDVSTKARQSEIASRNDYTSVQWKDMAAYAQSASWAKKQQDYVAYFNDILNLSKVAVDNLNKHYGLRFYSFSDYTAAFIVENMQQVTDAAIRGLKGLGYTKDVDFARIFAPTGMNINISMYAHINKETGEWEIDPRQSANLEDAIKLRDEYPNVGIVVTASTDEGVDWALKQKWSDVVIPFHIVRTGADVAEFYNWQNYTTESADTIADEKLWNAYVNGRKKVSKNIYPAEHQNNKETYLKLIKERGLKPRFERFLDNPNYMKLVNETRQSAKDTKPMQPTFDVDAAEKSFNAFVGKGGYFKGWYKQGVNVDAEADAVAKDVAEGKKANEVDYGRQDIDTEALMKQRNAVRKHSRAKIDVALDNKITERVQTVVNNMTMAERWQKVLEDLKLGKADQWIKAQIAWTDEQAGIIQAGKNVGVVVHGEVQRARVAKASAINMLNDSQRDYSGKKRVGDSLKAIFKPIQSRGKKVAQGFNLYLLHQLNVDRMSAVERGLREEVAPVFEEKVDKAFSLEKIKKLEKQYPEFKATAEKVWKYSQNLLQYRVDAGLITQAQADKMTEMYPHYVPVFYEKNGGGTSGAFVGQKGIAVKTGIKSAKGSTGVSDIKDVQASIAKQTVAVVRAASINKVVEKLYDGAVAKGDFTDIEEVGREKMTDPDVDYDKEIPKEDNVYFYKDGERITLAVTQYVDAGFRGLTAGAQLGDPLTTLSAKAISLFKKLVTSYNPLFAVTNTLRDAQEAVFYTKYPKRFFANYGKALVTRKSDTRLKELWEQYKAMGGTGSGYFSRETGVFDDRSKLRKGVEWLGDKMQIVNEWVEQAPRFAEFVASVEAGNSLEQALYDSAEVTTNFSRGGKMAKALNRHLIPFLNPSIQGWSKMWRGWVAPMDGKSAAEIERLSKQSKGRRFLSNYGALMFKAILCGVSVGLFNDMLYRWIDDDEDYANLPLNIKENYYLIKVGKKFIKIPKGRVVALYGSVCTRLSEAMNGNEDALNAWDWAKSASEMVSPLESAFRSIIAPVRDVQTNTTWYGGQIENASMENLAPSERYDEGTSSIAIAMGKTFNYSPKKIHYLLDQYSGVIGDVILPLTTNKAENGMLSARFVVDPLYNNDISTKYYDYKEELTFAKNSGDTNAKLMLKYMNEVQDALSKMYQQKRDIANDKSLSNKEKREQTEIVQSLINATLSSSVDMADEFEQLLINSGFEQAVGILGNNATYKKMDEKAQNSAYNKLTEYYYEVCLANLNDAKLDTKYTLYGAINATDIVVYLTEISNIESDKDKKGNTISGSRKEKVQKYIQGLRITTQQKYILSYLAGYAPTDNGKSAISKYLKNNGYTQKEVNDLWKD